MIPKEFNFIYLYGPQTRQFNINHRLSVASNIEVNKPKKVRIFTNDPLRLESSRHYQYIKLKYGDLIELIDTIRISTIVSNYLGFDTTKLPYMAHVADMYRLYIMYEYGGVYSDVDSIAVNPLPKSFWKSDKPIYFPEVYDITPDSLCNGFFLAPKSFRFMQIWLDYYAAYKPEDCMPGTDNWTKFSVQLGWKLYQNDPTMIHLESDPRLIEPLYLTYQDTQDIFYLNRSHRIKGCYQMHLWETRNKDLLKIIDEDYFKECNSTYAKLGRRFL